MITGKGLCFCCSISIAIVICLFLSTIYIRFSFKGPRCYIKELYVPALDFSQNPISNTNNKNNNTLVINPCLFFDMAFHNIQTHDGLLYGNVNITFSYGQNVVGSHTVPSFFQEAGKTDYRRELVESRGVPWEKALKAVLNGSTVVFRVDLAAGPRSHNDEGYSKKKRVRIGADVEINESGMKVIKENIMLYSTASKTGLRILVVLLSLFSFVAV